MPEIYDIAIIGGGPAGLTAGLYASRARMKTVLIERMVCGGQMLITDTIENFPGFPGGIKGPELADWMFKQAGRFGLEVKSLEAKGLVLKDKESDPFLVGLTDEAKLEALSVIISTGATWNSLGIPGEKELTGRGVSYCATCDGPIFKGKDVAVIGGGDTALEDALFLAKFAAKVTIIHRRDRFRGTKILQERILANHKIEVRFNSVAVAVTGERKCEALEIKDVNTGAAGSIKASGVFVLIGMAPNSGIFKPVIKTDDKGYILCDDDMKTSASGIFACGDVRCKSLRQVVTAAGDGATAAFSAQHYVERLKGVEYK
ncbi:MAG: thioredoxin-disulfide reductase [Candidatus Omnitrophota bacterium]